MVFVISDFTKGKKGHLTLYSKNGQIQEIENVEEIIKIQKRHFKKGEFFMANLSLPIALIQKNYNGTTYKVLMYLLTQLDFNNRIKTFRQIDIADAIKTNQANVSRALKVLESDKLIYKDGLDYYFNDEYIKGAGDN